MSTSMCILIKITSNIEIRIKVMCVCINYVFIIKRFNDITIYNEKVYNKDKPNNNKVFY